MDRPGSPREGKFGLKELHFQFNSTTSSPRRVMFAVGQAGTQDRVEVSPRPNLVQEHLERFKASLQDPGFPGGHNAKKKFGKSNSSSSVDIEPQLRAMGAISHERMVVDSSSALGPRPSWEDTRPHLPAPPLVQMEYIAKLDRSLHRPRLLGSSAARIALLSQLGGGASDMRSWGRRVPPTSVLWADIAELRGSRRLRQYIAERKRDGEAPLELLTDLADGWEELRQRQRRRQQHPQQQPQENMTPAVGSVRSSNVAVVATAATTPTATAAISTAAPHPLAGSASTTTTMTTTALATRSCTSQQQSPPQPVVYVAESDWPAAAAAVAAAAAAAVGVDPSLSTSTSAAALLGPQSSSVSNASGNVTRFVDGPAKPAPTSVVLVHFPKKTADSSAATAADTAAALAGKAATVVSAAAARPPPRAPRRASSLQTLSVTEVTPSVSVSISPARKSLGSSSETSAAAAAVAAGFVPSLERYHTTYTLPSRALTTGADKLSPRTLVSATRLVEVVEVVQPPRMRPHLRLSESSGAGVGGGGGGVASTAAAVAAATGGEVCPAPQLPVRRHSVADPACWAAGFRANSGGRGGGGGTGELARLATDAAANARKLAAGASSPVAAWAAMATAATAAVEAETSMATTAKAPSVDVDAETEVRASQGSSPQLGTFEAAASVVLHAQRWKRLAASPAAGTQIGPGAFAHVATVTEEAVPARTLGLVPALATSASQIVVLSAPASPPPSAAVAAAVAVPQPSPGPLETKRMKSQTVAQLEKRWSLNGRAAVAAAAAALASTSSSSSCSLQLPFLSSSSSLSGTSSTMASSGLYVKDGTAATREAPPLDNIFITQACDTGIVVMDVIHEGDEADNLAGGQALTSNNRHRSHTSDPGQDRPASLLPMSSVPATATGLPPRPPQRAYRSRSLVTIPLLNSTIPNSGGGGCGGCRTLTRASSSFGTGGRLCVQALPYPQAETSVAAAAATAAGDVQVETTAATSASGSTVSAGTDAFGGGQVRHQSLRRLLSDQVRLATMVYGGDSKGELDKSRQIPLELLSNLPPPVPQLRQQQQQQQRREEPQEAAMPTLMPMSPLQQPQQQQQQQQQTVVSADMVPMEPPSDGYHQDRHQQQQAQFMPHLPLSSMQQETDVTEPHELLPAQASRQSCPQHGDSSSQDLLRHSLCSLSTVTAAGSSARSSISGGSVKAAADSNGGHHQPVSGLAATSLTGSITDHSADLSCLPGDPRCTLSSFFTGGSSIAPSEVGLASAAPSAELSWAQAPGSFSRVSSASSSSSSSAVSRSSSSSSYSRRALAAVLPRPEAAAAGPTAAADDMQTQAQTPTDDAGTMAAAAATMLSSLQVTRSSSSSSSRQRMHNLRKSAAAASGDATSVMSRPYPPASCQPHVSPLVRMQDQTTTGRTTKRSGGGFVIIGTSRSGHASASARLAAVGKGPATAAALASGGHDKVLPACIHVEVDAELPDEDVGNVNASDIQPFGNRRTTVDLDTAEGLGSQVVAMVY